MEFYDPVVDDASHEKGQSEETRAEKTETNVKTEHAVEQIESEIDKVYTLLETKFQGLLHEDGLQSKELMAQLNKLKENVNVTGNLEYLEKQLSTFRTNVSKDYSLDKLTAQLSNINTKGFDIKGLSEKLPFDLDANLGAIDSQLDSLDSKLEVVERKGGEYLTQVTSFFSNFISVTADDEAEKSASKEDLTFPTISASKSYSTSRYDSELYKLHTTESLYKESDEEFDVEAKTDEISSLLKKYPSTLDKLMNQLVPVQISYKSFWNSYFKQLESIDQAESKRKELLANVKEEDFSWDDDEEAEAKAAAAASTAAGTDKDAKSDKHEESDDDWE